MKVTLEQIASELNSIAMGKDGYQQILKMTLEAIMKAERNEFNSAHNDNSNGFRFRSVFAHGGQLELKVPRTRSQNFYPLILALIKEQDEESKILATELYQAGLTTIEVGELFEKIYLYHFRCKRR